jgi:hypothetical protein
MPDRPTRRRAIAPERRGSQLVFEARDGGHGPERLTDLGCPDCRGVLAVEAVPGTLQMFRCSIGHVYEGQGLVAAKEAQLEMSLWSAVEVFEEVRLLHEELARAARLEGREEQALEYERRAARATRESERLREIIASDTPPARLV